MAERVNRFSIPFFPDRLDCATVDAFPHDMRKVRRATVSSMYALHKFNSRKIPPSICGFSHCDAATQPVQLSVEAVFSVWTPTYHRLAANKWTVVTVQEPPGWRSLEAID